MAQPVVWLRAALDELDEIAEYIATDSPSAAAAVVGQIQRVSMQLGEFPRMGPRVPEWDDDDLRQRVVFSYRVIYRVTDVDIEIIGIVHGARLLPASIRRRNR